MRTMINRRLKVIAVIVEVREGGAPSEGFWILSREQVQKKKCEVFGVKFSVWTFFLNLVCNLYPSGNVKCEKSGILIGSAMSLGAPPMGHQVTRLLLYEMAIF